MTYSVQVKNKRTYTGAGCYVGRPSPLGNPFTIGKDGDRDEVVEKYEIWLVEQLKTDTPAKYEFDRLLTRLKLLHSLVLVCWCWPKRCHADIIAKLLIEWASR